MPRLAVWIHRGLWILFTMLFLEQLSLEQMSASPLAAHQEFHRAFIASLDLVVRFTLVSAEALAKLSAFVAVVSVTIWMIVDTRNS